MNSNIFLDWVLSCYHFLSVLLKKFLLVQDGLIWSYFVGLIILFTILEYIRPIRPTRGSFESLKDEFTFLISNKFVNFVISAITISVIKLLNIPPLFPSLILIPKFWQFIILIFCGELIYYWYHRALHRVKWLWEIHKIHHSIEDINAINGNLRYHVVEIMLNYLITALPILLMGFSSDLLYAFIFIQLFVNTWAHSNVGFTYGILSRWVVTTQVHQFHHDADPPIPSGVNYGNMFTFCDRIFGTFFLPIDGYPKRLGLIRGAKEGKYPYPVKGYLKQQLYPLRKLLPKKFFKQNDNILPYKVPKFIPKNLRKEVQKGKLLAPTTTGDIYPEVDYYNEKK